MGDKTKLTGKQKLEVAIQTGLQAIPYVGAPLATAYFGSKQVKEFNRLQEFYNQLSKDMESIKSSIVPIDMQYEDGLMSLIEQINSNIEKEHQSRKIQCYKNYMRNMLTNQITEYNYDKKKLFLEVLQSMSIIEIEVVSELYKLEKNLIVKVSAFSRAGFDTYAFVGVMSKLKSYGFLKTQQEQMFIGGGEDNLLNESVAINDYGREFVEFVLQ